jgi:hypothetical protein
MQVLSQVGMQKGQPLAVPPAPLDRCWRLCWGIVTAIPEEIDQHSPGLDDVAERHESAEAVLMEPERTVVAVVAAQGLAQLARQGKTERLLRRIQGACTHAGRKAGKDFGGMGRKPALDVPPGFTDYLNHLLYLPLLSWLRPFDHGVRRSHHSGGNPFLSGLNCDRQLPLLQFLSPQLKDTRSDEEP